MLDHGVLVMGVNQRHLELQVLSPAAQEQGSWSVKQLDFKEEVVDEARGEHQK